MESVKIDATVIYNREIDSLEGIDGTDACGTFYTGIRDDQVANCPLKKGSYTHQKSFKVTSDYSKVIAVPSFFLPV